MITPSDYSKGFGGKYGVEKDRQDASAAGWTRDEEEEKEEVEKVTRTVGKLNLDKWNKAPEEVPREKAPKPKMNIKKNLPELPKVAPLQA